MVYYACPMIFEKAALYEVNVDLDGLRLVDLSSCPSDFSDNSKHYIYFDNTQSQPIWCSEPVEGKAINPQQFAERVVGQLKQTSPDESVKQVSELLLMMKENDNHAQDAFGQTGPKNFGLSAFADSLTIIRIDEILPEK
ncbi:hypothetical protein CSQ93_14275 [Janthinobacterium sp. BJB426]|nr:hypothetical protein CSQ93_14275 [Janthinobacterium sp. BJB426]